jgi:hypothetical protein
MILTTRWCATATLTAWTCFSLSCAHTPDADPHIHASVEPLTLNVPTIIQGRVTDATTGEPVPHALVYLVDVRSEYWKSLQSHSARLGTADRHGRIDLGATWSTRREIDPDVVPVFSLAWVRDLSVLGDEAEARCRAGNPANVAVVVEDVRHYGRYYFFDTNQLPVASGEMVLDVGELVLDPLPEDYWCYPSLMSAESENLAVTNHPAEATP